ncbi:MAG: HAD family phosphatase [Bacteroidales bacterium]|nr:HAD family phosphatase [Bacteroidales bacterium]
MKINIKTILFDFGGVILNIDHHRLEQAFGKLGIENFEELYGRAKQSPIFQQLEKGEISAGEFRSKLIQLANLQISDIKLDETWNAIILDFPPQRIELLQELKSKYRLLLLSNTNIIHYDHYMDMFTKKFGFDFNGLFDEVYWSFQIGMRKPDPDPYLHIINDKKLDPNQMLFIDDTFANIKIARQLGIHAHFLEQGMDVNELFTNAVLKPQILQEAVKQTTQ